MSSTVPAPMTCIWSGGREERWEGDRARGETEAGAGVPRDTAARGCLLCARPVRRRQARSSHLQGRGPRSLLSAFLTLNSRIESEVYNPRSQTSPSPNSDPEYYACCRVSTGRARGRRAFPEGWFRHPFISGVTNGSRVDSADDRTRKGPTGAQAMPPLLTHFHPTYTGCVFLNT